MTARILTGDALEALRAIAEDVDPGRPLETVAEVRALPDRVRAVLAERDAALARVARLERVLAVEGGDKAQAPPGWKYINRTGWLGPDGSRVEPDHPIGWRWDGRPVPRTWCVRYSGRTATALEAMEAADAAGEVAT